MYTLDLELTWAIHFDIYDKVSSFFLLEQISQFWRRGEIWSSLNRGWKRDTLLKVREHFHIFHRPGTQIEKCFLSSIYHIKNLSHQKTRIVKLSKPGKEGFYWKTLSEREVFLKKRSRQRVKYLLVTSFLGRICPSVPSTCSFWFGTWQLECALWVQHSPHLRSLPCRCYLVRWFLR